MRSTDEKLTTQDAFNVIALRISEVVDEPELGGLDALDAVVVMRAVAAEADAALTEAMAAAHRSGITLDRIGQEIGISRQAVWNRLDRANLLAPR